MYIPKYTFAKLLQAKMFLGGARRMWNPEIVPYLSGSRNRTSILDLTNTSFRLRKFLCFIELLSHRRGRTLFILRPAFAPLGEIIYPHADYHSRYIGGAVSNFRYILRHLPYYKRVESKKFWARTRFPSAVVLFGDYTRRVDYMLNESLCTRTPSALLSDATGFSFAVPYHIPATSDFSSARLMTNYVLAAIKRGKRHEKLFLRRSFRTLVKKAVKTCFSFYGTSQDVVTSVQKSPFFAVDPRRRQSLFRFYFKHQISFIFPKENTDLNHKFAVRKLWSRKKFCNVKLLLKPFSAYRAAVSLITKLGYVLRNKRILPLFTEHQQLFNRLFWKRFKRSRFAKNRYERRKSRWANKLHPNILRNKFMKKNLKNRKKFKRLIGSLIKNPTNRPRIRQELFKNNPLLRKKPLTRRKKITGREKEIKYQIPFPKRDQK